MATTQPIPPAPHRGRFFGLVAIPWPSQGPGRSGGVLRLSRETLFSALYLSLLAFSPSDGAKRGQVKG